MLLCLPFALMLTLSGPASDGHVRAIAPFVGDDVAIVAHFDLTRLDIEALCRRLLLEFADEEEIAEASRSAAAWVGSLRKAGAKEIFLLLSIADLPGPPVAVVPLVAGADAKAIGAILCGSGPEKFVVSWPTCATVHEAVFAGTTAALERVRQPIAEPRADLAAAFAAAGDAPARLLILPGRDARRVLEEMLPVLPKELGGLPTSTLSRGALWAAISLETEPKPGFRLVVQARDATAANALVGLGRDAVGLIGQVAARRVGRSDFAKELTRLKPEVSGDRIVLDVDTELASALVAVPASAAQEGTHKARCVTNLKQIALAMHNYHQTYKSFPPAYTRDKQGKPLLSWRVQILPFLDQQQALHEQFHQDEPWDSPHNKTLIDKMPAVFACPSEARKLRKSGMTTYLAPRGKATVLPGAAGVKLAELTDGTSNTIMVVDASDALAVIWTKPDDWDVDPEPKREGLFGHHERGTEMSFADGSVRFIKATISPVLLRGLLTRNGNEIIRDEDH
jgi:hypothetical protein